jgi:N-methylhydantoinase B
VSPNVAEVIRTDGSREEYPVVTGLTVSEGDLIRIRTGNGAGYGDPAGRDPEAVAADVRNGLNTRARAREVYGQS